MQPPRLIPRLTLENAVIDALFSDPAAASEFKGCLDLIANAPAEGCSKCGKVRKAASAYANAKMCFAQMADEKKNRLKALLSAKQVEIVVRDGQGLRRYFF